MKEIIIVLSLILVLSGCQYLTTGASVPLDNGCVSNEPTTFEGYSTETLKNIIGGGECQQYSTHSLYCYANSNSILIDSEFMSWREGSMQDMTTKLGRTLFNNSFFQSSDIQSELTNGYTYITYVNHFTKDGRLKIYRVPDSCSEYLNNVHSPSASFFSDKFQKTFYTKMVPSGTTQLGEEPQNFEKVFYWCDENNWYLFETNNEAMLSLIFDELSEPEDTFRHSEKYGRTIFGIDGGGFLLVNNNLEIKMSSLDVVNKYFETFITCPPPECSSEQTKEYTCPNGNKVNWCVCEDNKWNCIVTPSTQCETTCTPNWQCPDYENVACVNSLKTRVCKDLNNCQSNKTEYQSCEEEGKWYEKCVFQWGQNFMCFPLWLLLLIIGIIGMILFSTKKK